MNSRFKYREDLVYPELESHTSDDGDRIYLTPTGWAPSVTTIISTLPHPGLDKWRNRVGEEEAERVSEEARNIGTHVHDMLECYVRSVDYELKNTPEEKLAKNMFTAVKMMGLRNLQEVWGIEVSLFYENLFAGRTDLVGVYEEKPSIIDYKTGRYFKRNEWIEDYKLQVASYAICHDYLFPEEEIEQCVLLIGTRANPDYKVLPNCQRVVIGKDELQYWKERWIRVLEDYYNLGK